MATIWSELGKLGHSWVIPMVGAGFTALVLVFGYIFESAYYEAFGVEMTVYASNTYLAFSPFRHPVTFAWAVLFTFVFTVNLRLIFGMESNKQAMQPVFLLAVMLYGSYLVISGDAKEQAEALRPINIPSVDSEGTPQTFLLIGNIGPAYIVCDPESGRVKKIESPNAIEYLDAGEVNAMRCWRSETK